MCAEVGLSFGISGCGVLNCLEETWEERGTEWRGRREERVEGDFLKAFFHPRVTYIYSTDWTEEGLCECARMTTCCGVFLLTSICFGPVAEATGTTDCREEADTPTGVKTESGCGLWLEMDRATLTGKNLSYFQILPASGTFLFYNYHKYSRHFIVKLFFLSRSTLNLFKLWL